MRPTFRATVLCGLLAAQLVTVLALVLVSGRITGAAETQHNDVLLENAAIESADRVRSHIEPVESIVEITTALASEPGIEAADFRRAFFAALARSPQLAGVFIGTPDGGFVDVRRDGTGVRTKTIVIEDGVRTTTLEFYGESGQLVQIEADPTDTFDPRERPWYQQAQTKRGRVAWTDPYVFFSSGQPGITAAKTIMRDSQVAGVVAADIELGSLSTFLGGLQINGAGGTVIFDDAGPVIAHPDPTLLQVEGEDGLRPVTISELQDPMARAAVGALADGGAPTTDSVIYEFESDDVDARASFRSIPVAEGQWTVGVFAPDGELVPDLTTARAQERWLTIAVGVLSFLLAGLVALNLTRPIRELEARANTDSLTGLPNRRSALEEAERAIASSKTVGAAILDLDHFKSINDNHGHLVGDEVLIGVTRRIQSAIREGEGALGRIGGEEFLVLFRDMNEHDAAEVCNRIAERIRSKPFATTAGPIQMTASVGLWVTDSQPDLSRLMTLADGALFEAKHSGRDRLIIHRENGVVDAPRQDEGGSLVAG